MTQPQAQTTIDFDPMLQFFLTSDLSEPQQSIAVDYAELALKIVKKLPKNPERTVALRKLLESRDCAMRAVVYVL